MFAGRERSELIRFHTKMHLNIYNLSLMYKLYFLPSIWGFKKDFI